MLAIQVALCLLTGSLEMSVFQTLSAGNIWHFGAPGTARALRDRRPVDRCGTRGPDRDRDAGEEQREADEGGEPRRRERAGGFAESDPSSVYRRPALEP